MRLIFQRLQPCMLAGLFFLASCKQAELKKTVDWSAFGGGKENTHYVDFAEIDTSNIGQLKVAWVYHTGDADTANHSQMQCNPIIVNGVMYATSPTLKLVAVDASNGKEKWVFNPRDSNQNKTRGDFIMNNNRGVTYWESGEDKRIFFAAGAWVYAIDANTGKMITSFGRDGRIDLHEGLDRDVHDRYIAATSPGIIFKDLLIMGARVDEGPTAAPGHIRAFDVRTGERKWIFHTIPQPGEFGYDSWEDSIAYKNIGGVNCWSGFSMDEKRGILFVPLGSASFDFYGGKRKGKGLFANSLVALDAATGKRLWHYQYVHHDVWDRDFPTPPALVTVMHNGQKVDAVAQPSKLGFVYVFNRETGESLFPIDEVPVPTNSELKGEKLSPTQPVPQKPKALVRQSLTEADLNTLVADSSYQDIKKRFQTYKTGSLFTPPSFEGTIVFPGFDGGFEWGGPGYDPQRGWLIVNANEMVNILTMKEMKNEIPKKETRLQAGMRLYESTCMACHGPERKGGGNYPSLLGADKKYDPTQFSLLVTNGRRMMPAFKQLSPAEIQAIASFVLEEKKEQALPYRGPVKALDSFLNLPYGMTGYIKFMTKDGYPALSPPWGTLNALDLNTGELVWKVTLGEYPEFKAKGIITGTENYGGPVVTAGGLVFIAATRDSKFRAFHSGTGKLLWEADLPAPGFATPAGYVVNGKQFVVIACGGGKLGTNSGDAYVAFALPEKN